jgi:hypothetical protein
MYNTASIEEVLPTVVYSYYATFLTALHVGVIRFFKKKGVRGQLRLNVFEEVPMKRRTRLGPMKPRHLVRHRLVVTRWPQ